MLKKAGILVGIAAAGVLALTPLAFAHESETPHDVNTSSIQDHNLSNDCPLGQNAGDITSTLKGGDSFLGAAGLVTDVIAPVTTQTQAANCTNIGISDVIDSNSNNTTDEFTSTEVEDSFNTEG